MTKFQNAVSVFCVAAVSLFLPCAAAPLFAPSFPDIDDAESGKTKTSNSANKPSGGSNKQAAAPASAPVVAPPPTPVPVPPPAPAPAFTPIVEDEEYDDAEDFGDRRPLLVEEAVAAPAAEEPEAETPAPAEKEKKEKKKKEKKEKKEKPEKAEKPVKPPNRLKFGGRLAYNNSYVAALSVVVDEEVKGEIIGKQYENKPGLGSSGFEVGAAVDIRLAGPLSLYTGLNFAIRNPVAIEGALTISEMAVNVPVLFRIMLGKPVFLDIGGQLDIPFGTKIKRDWNGAVEDFEGRAAIDGGAVLGIGCNIIYGLSIDAKGVIGLRNFDKEHDKPVYQASVGVSYMY